MAIRPLEAVLQEKAESELNENVARIQDDLQDIRDWLKDQQHLNVRTDDQWLISFLRGSKFNFDRTKLKIDYFYTMRTLVPEFFGNRDPFLPEIQDMLNSGVLLPLPKTEDLAGPRIIFFRFEACNTDELTIVDLSKLLVMTLDILMNEDDNFVVGGMQLWAEYTGFPLKYMLQFTPDYIRKIVHCLQTAYPLRIKGIHCTNIPVVFEALANISKPLLSKKLRKRLNVLSHKHFDKVYEDIPKSLMPKEYGGDNGSLEELKDVWKEKVESYRNWFMEDAEYHSEEELRPGKPKTAASEFGVIGAIKKLFIH